MFAFIFAAGKIRRKERDQIKRPSRSGKLELMLGSDRGEESDGGALEKWDQAVSHILLTSPYY